MADVASRERAMLKIVPKISLRMLAAAALIALAVPMSADAGEFRYGGPGGIAMGAIVGVPLGGPYVGPAFTPLVGYEPFSFDAPFPVACPGGYWAHRPLVNRWGNVYGYSAPRFFCP
jgi:hypothetical protein